jgi:hypothetical protein
MVNLILEQATVIFRFKSATIISFGTFLPFPGHKPPYNSALNILDYRQFVNC